MFSSLLICTCALTAITPISVTARPQESPAPAAQPEGSSSTPIPIVSQTEVVGPDGSFNYSYESGNGIKVEQSGYLKRAPSTSSRSGELKEGEEEEDEVQVLQGSYSYTAPDGQQISLRYVADENGFQPEGDHLPTTPAVPSGILASLRNAPESEPNQSQPAAAAAEPQAEPEEPAPAVPATATEESSTAAS